jgi:prepilin-type N-terminal cleavage/methylation domain-containing protein
MKAMWVAQQKGFTIVELLIVIVVIAILATISIVAYSGVQARANNAQVQASMRAIQRKLQAYHIENGSYPATQSNPLLSGSWAAGNMSNADANCPYNFTPYTGVTLTTKTTAWVPEIDMALPQSSGQKRGNWWGCYVYQSDGKNYLLSAWNMVGGGPQTDTMYQRVGYREMGQSFQVYYCNYGAIGGYSGGVYDINKDFYKHSYTISSITCNETPPAGA